MKNRFSIIKSHAADTAVLLGTPVRNFGRALFGVCTLAALTTGVFGLHLPVNAQITGTRPTLLSSVLIKTISSTQISVSGKLTDSAGSGLAGILVQFYSVGNTDASYFGYLGLTYTSNGGNFSVTLPYSPEATLVPSQPRLQIDIPGNGAYNRPLPTFDLSKTTAPAPSTRAFQRYSKPGGYWVSSTSVPSGYQFQGTVGYVYTSPVEGTIPIYSCQVPGATYGNLISQASNCEGQITLGLDGYIYATQPQGISTQPLYRCEMGSGPRFISNSSTCEGQRLEALMGFAKSIP
jgi:hypothetical protein